MIVLFAVILGFVQEYRAERAIEALREMAAPTGDRRFATGASGDINAHELVPGDLILLATGDKVPADVTLDRSRELANGGGTADWRVSSHSKAQPPTRRRATATGDRKNLAYAGTVVTYGRGRAVVVATGMATEFGKIAQIA